jgi:hypothetical protein
MLNISFTTSLLVCDTLFFCQTSSFLGLCFTTNTICFFLSLAIRFCNSFLLFTLSAFGGSFCVGNGFLFCGDAVTFSLLGFEL